MPGPRRRLPFRFIVWLTMAAALVSGTGVWLAQALGPRHVHEVASLEDFRRIVAGHGPTAHAHADARSHRHHDTSIGTTVLGANAEASNALLDAGLAAAVLATGACWHEPVAQWRGTPRPAVEPPFPASHDTEPESPPPKQRTPEARA